MADDQKQSKAKQLPSSFNQSMLENYMEEREKEKLGHSS